MIETIIWFSKAIAAYVLNIKTNEKLYYSGFCLLHKNTFMLQNEAGKDRFIAVRVLYRTIKEIFTGAPPDFSSVKDTSMAIYNGHITFKEGDIRYLKYCRDYNVELFISRDMLLAESGINKIWISFISIFLAIPLIVCCIFHTRRTNIALLLPEFLQTRKLLIILTKYSVQNLHWMSISEIDANIGTLILQQHGITVIKYQSPTPLMVHNRILIADTLCVCSAYQREELSHASGIFFINKIQDYYPYGSHECFDVYASSPVACKESLIGYYSHAGWLRKKLKNTHALFSNTESELELLNILSGFFSENKQYKLVIYPHPKEKDIRFIDEAQSFYTDKFKNCNCEIISDRKKSTSAEFHKVNIAIATFSAVLFERLFFGYKTLFYTKGLKDFPMPQSPLANICATSKDELLSLILENIPLLSNDFFVKHHLREYPCKKLMQFN